MNQLYFCRHGKTSWNQERRIQGRTDIPLNPEGIAQSKDLAHYFKASHIQADAVISSPLLRAKETASFIAQALSVELICDDDLIEVDTGKFTGKTMDELQSDASWQAYLNDPASTPYGECGESATSVLARMTRAIERYDGNIIFVSHANPIRHAISSMLQMPKENLYHLSVYNASVSLIKRFDHVHKLVFMNICPSLLRACFDTTTEVSATDAPLR